MGHRDWYEYQVIIGYDQAGSARQYLVSIDSQVFILSNRFHSVIAYMDCFIAAHLLCAVTVSYTHLDVYKRQPYHH